MVSNSNSMYKNSDGKQFHQIQQTNKPLLITIH
jgi:hypothetical protein